MLPEADPSLDRPADAAARGEAIIPGYTHLHAKLGRVDEARKLLAEITARSHTEYVSPMDRAVLHADLGEKEAAFELLERAYEERVPALSRIKATGLLKGLRSDPRFEDRLRRMKLLCGPDPG